MTTPVAVAVVHGVGRTGPDFADGLAKRLRERFRAVTGVDGLVICPVHWAPALQARQDLLWTRLQKGGPLSYVRLRRFMVDFAGDAIAYQPLPGERAVYEAIHAVMAHTLKTLAVSAGDKAPLCVIAHSLGSVVASNYLYDLQTHPRRPIIPDPVLEIMGSTPLERGDTLAGFYTLGSPLALWSLRHKDFGRPIAVPPPGEWVNFYDRHDVIATPLKSINDAYRRAVTADRAVNVGGVLSGWTPASHTAYWTDRRVTHPIADALARLWTRVQ